MPKTAARRPLEFATLERVMPEVDRLLLGHATAGNWSLGQICRHLAWALTASVDGFPRQAPWLFRRTIGRVLLKRLLKSGRMPEGAPVPGGGVPGPGLDARAEAEALRAALRFFIGHTGPLHEHPFFGPVTRAGAERIHCIHCAHHLSFVLPLVDESSRPADSALSGEVRPM